VRSRTTIARDSRGFFELLLPLRAMCVYVCVHVCVYTGDFCRREVTEFCKGKRQLRFLYIRGRELVGHTGKPEALSTAEHHLPLSLPGEAQRNRLVIVR